MTHITTAMVDRLLDFIFPPHCFGCKTTGEYLCKNCKKTVKPHPEICLFCHKPTRHRCVCLDCKTHHRHLEGVIIWFVYTTTIKQLIVALKRWHRYRIAFFLAKRLVLLIQSHEFLRNQLSTCNKRVWGKPLIITSVPTHRRKKYVVRWYSQSECLARTLATLLEVTYTPLFVKSKYTISQTKLTKSKRLINLLGSFSLCKDLSLCGDETILIVDDVTTTGATLDHLSWTIKTRYPNLTVWWIVVGRHGK